MRNNYFEDSNQLTIIANTVEVIPEVDSRRGFRDLRPSVKIKVAHYDLKAVLINMLEDYNAEDLIALIREIEAN